MYIHTHVHTHIDPDVSRSSSGWETTGRQMTPHTVGPVGHAPARGSRHLHTGKPFSLPLHVLHVHTAYLSLTKACPTPSSVPPRHLLGRGCLASSAALAPRCLPPSLLRVCSVCVCVCVGSVSTEPTDTVTLEGVAEADLPNDYISWERPGLSGSASHPPESRTPGTLSPVSHPRTRTARDPPRDPHSPGVRPQHYPPQAVGSAVSSPLLLGPGDDSTVMRAGG